MPVERVTRSQAVTTLKQYYDTLLPGFDVQTEGSPEEDMFINAPVFGALGKIHDDIAEISQLQTLDDPQVFSEEDLDAKLNGNDGFQRNPASFATGFVTYSTSSLTSDIVISSGAVVGTQGGVQFSVNGTHTMFFAVASSYFDQTTQRFSITVPIQCTRAGESGNVKSNQIVLMVTQVSGITNITNFVPTTGGGPEETNVDYVERYKEKIRGTEITSFGGMIKAIDSPDNGFTQVVDRVLVKAGHPLMVRDEGVGGMVDIYILGDSLQTVRERVVFRESVLTSTGEITLTQRPVRNLEIVVGEVITTSAGQTQIQYGDAVLQKDLTSTVAGSTSSQDKVIFNIANQPVDGDTVIVTYVYNSLISLIQQFFNTNVNRSPNSDILIKEALRVDVSLSVTVAIDSAFNTQDVIDEIRSEIVGFINSSILGEGFTRFDIANVLDDVDGVTNVDLDEIVIIAPEANLNANGDLVSKEIEYPRVATDSLGNPLITVLNTSNFT